MENKENVNEIKAINQTIDLVYPVGIFVDSNNPDFDPNEKWGGRWREIDDGRINVPESLHPTATAGSSQTENAVPLLEIGQRGGKFSHLLNYTELPNKTIYNHAYSDKEGLFLMLEKGGGTGWNFEYGYQIPLDLMQAYRVVKRWNRLPDDLLEACAVVAFDDVGLNKNSPNYMWYGSIETNFASITISDAETTRSLYFVTVYYNDNYRTEVERVY